MSTLSSFRGFLPKRDKSRCSDPDFAGPLAIGTALYKSVIWVNSCKDGTRRYLALHLRRQGFGSEHTIKLALWQKGDHFEARFEGAQCPLIFRARIRQREVELSLESAQSFDRQKLLAAKERLPIHVLWQALALPGTVRPRCCVKSPLRDDDRNPSFSIFEDGQRFRDHGSGLSGDAYDFFRLVTGLSSWSAYERFLELAQIPLPR